MIYSFATTDGRSQALIDILRGSGIDFDITEHDHVVVRVLGQITPELEHRLTDAGISTQALTLTRSSELGCYEYLLNRDSLSVIAGPCAVEDEEQLQQIAESLNKLEVKFLRGGAFKPRTRVDSFQGLGLAGLKLLRKYADRYDMFVVTEVMDRSQIETVAEYADILQIGSRNMFNYTLLTAIGSTNLPVLVKRGMAATISEWVLATEYVSRGGNDKIILCERGIRTFEPEIAHTLDLAAIALAKSQTTYPIVADPSHAAGRADLVEALALGGIAAGADAIMVEVHPNPAAALSDGPQALNFTQFEHLLESAKKIFTARKSFSATKPNA